MHLGYDADVKKIRTMGKSMIPFIDLKAQQAHIRESLEAALSKVLDHGAYVMGPEVYECEKQLAEFCGAKHALSCSSGTDALSMVLMAKHVGFAGERERDAVFVPAFTFTATAEVVSLVGATPVFVDIDPVTFNMCPESLKAAISVAKEQGLNLCGVMPVDLFGQPADYDALESIARENNMWVLADAAQSFGATYKSRKVGAIGDATATSFFPAKPLGCYGDGGAVFTDDDELAALMHSIRVHGQGADKYENPRIGLNARMDTMQAAVLIEKLKLFPDELTARQNVAERYEAALSNYAITPQLAEGNSSSWAQYTLRVEADDRDDIQARLREENVPTAVYYPIPLHQQVGYKHYPQASESLATSEVFSKTVISLPMHPYLDKQTQDKIIAAVQNILPNRNAQEKVRA